MKRYKWIHRYVNSTGGQQMKLKLSIPVLLVGTLLSLFFIGCGTVINRFAPEDEYEAPQLPICLVLNPNSPLSLTSCHPKLTQTEGGFNGIT